MAARRAEDDEEGEDRRHRAERVEHRRRDVGGHAVDLERQRVEGAGGHQRARELVIGEREAEQADADQARQRSSAARRGGRSARTRRRGRAPPPRRRGEKRLKTANMMRTPKGSVQVRCAPKAEEYQAGRMPAMLEHEADAEADDDRRHDEARDREVEQRRSSRGSGGGRRGRRAARRRRSPPSPSGRARASARSEPPKSPTACFSNRLPNQCTETPFIGKVRPPFGPWKDRMRMVDSGP